jgi:nitrite reductase/ring-hydroxylating ferredoxin subunit
MNGTISALAERCSHLGGPLSEGELEEDSIVCPWHKSKFQLSDGQPVQGPSAFQQPCLDLRVRDGQIEVRRGEPGGIHPD